MSEPGADRALSRAGQSDQKALRPRDAATLVIFDAAFDPDAGSAGATARILMGRRRMDQVFLPGYYVFPGGRVDRDDAKARPATPLNPSDAANLMLAMGGRPSAARAFALALAAVRETFEETGFAIGRPIDASDGKGPDVSPAWRGFFDCGMAPSLSELVFFARQAEQIHDARHSGDDYGLVLRGR